MYLSGMPKPSTRPIISGLSLASKIYFKSFNDLTCYLVINPPWMAGIPRVTKKLAPKSKHKVYVSPLIRLLVSLSTASFKHFIEKYALCIKPKSFKLMPAILLKT